MKILVRTGNNTKDSGSANDGWLIQGKVILLRLSTTFYARVVIATGTQESIQNSGVKILFSFHIRPLLFFFLPRSAKRNNKRTER
jgi:hypothetical protein